MINIRRIITLLFFQLFGIVSIYAQISSDDSNILLKIINSYVHNNKIAYVDTVNNGRIAPEQLLQAIKKRKISDVRKNNELLLTRKEKKYLLSNISNQTIWEKDIFPNSLLIPNNKVITFLAEQRKAFIDRKDTINIMNDPNGIHYVFTLTKPIYFRNQSLCMISYSAFCGNNCGVSETIILRKEHNDWENWIIVASGEF